MNVETKFQLCLCLINLENHIWIEATSLDNGALKYELQQIWRKTFRRSIYDSEIKSKKKQLECHSKFSYKSNINFLGITNVDYSIKESLNWSLNMVD